MVFPRSHPAPMETCGAIAAYDRIDGKATLWCTTQAPHAHRTLYSIITGLPEHKLRVISPDVGGGFGNKVPVYPGYVCALAGAMQLGRPVKWVEDRSREPDVDRLRARLRDARADRREPRRAHPRHRRRRARRPRRGQRRRAADALPGRVLPVFTGSYDIEAAHCRVTGAYTNKAPGGVAYSCSFRIAEAVYLVERLVDCLARELAIDPVELRRRNLIRSDQFPYASKTGWVYDSGNYEAALDKALALAGYDELRSRAAREARARRADGHRRLVLHRGRRRRPAQAHGHARAGHERRRVDPHVADRHRAGRDQRPDPGTGARDDVRADRRARARPRDRRRRGHPRRHRHDAVWPRHLRVAFDAGLRRRDRDRRAQGPRPRADRRRGAVGGRARGPGVARRPLVGRGRPVGRRDDPRARARRPRRRRPAGGHRDRPRRRGRLRPAEPHVPVRRLRLRRRHRPGHRGRQGPPLHRRRRLRRAHQPDDRRGPDPRRPDRRRRASR